MRCFEDENHRGGPGPIETSDSDANHAVLHAQDERRGLGPIETCNSAPKAAVLDAKPADKGWDPERLAILMLITLVCKHKMTGEVWDS